ncbi:MAG: MerR family transcriptional regulator [Sneathiella sp.]
MKQRIEEYSVGQLARLSGVTVRTLHHYDDIDLLKPAYIGRNGYRSYRRAEILRLQEILFYRDVGMPLAEIKEILAGPLNAKERLIQHRNRLLEEQRKAEIVIATLNDTIAHFEEDQEMEINDLYKPFSKEKQASYEEWLVTEYGDAMALQIQTSKAAIKELPNGMEGALTELKVIETALVTEFESGVFADSHALHPLLERHRNWVAKMWGRPCEANAFEGLGDLYQSQPDFTARYEALSPKFSAWLPASMKAHAARLRLNLREPEEN